MKVEIIYMCIVSSNWFSLLFRNISKLKNKIHSIKISQSIFIELERLEKLPTRSDQPPLQPPLIISSTRIQYTFGHQAEKINSKTAPRHPNRPINQPTVAMRAAPDIGYNSMYIPHQHKEHLHLHIFRVYYTPTNDIITKLVLNMVNYAINLP